MIQWKPQKYKDGCSHLFNRLIGFHGRPTGRFGNHIFQYYFLNKIANRLGSKTFHTKFLGNELFQGFHPKWINFIESNLRPSQPISYQSYAEVSWEDFLNAVSEIQKKNHVVSLPTGRLDWFFYDNQPNDISEIIKFRREPNYEASVNLKTIAIHFRGGDFLTLRPDWVLPQTYYEDAIDYLKQTGILFDSKMVLYTDEPTHPTVRNLLARYNITLNKDEKYIAAFKEMINSDVLISSNSTFSYWGGVLGRKKKVINSKEWIKKEINRGDEFWIPVRENRCNFLRDFVEV